MKPRTAGIFCLCIAALAAAPAVAAEIYFDADPVSDEVALGNTELFKFGPYGAGGEWAYTNKTIAGNAVGVFAARGGAGNGGHGASVHLAYPDALGDHAPLEPGKILRFSCWLAADPENPVNYQGWQFALLKFEFYQTALGHPDDWDALLFDSDRATDHKLIATYTNALSSTEWKQFSYEYAYDPKHFPVAELKEIRPVVVQGDFIGNTLEGNVLVDNLRVEIFPDAAAAAASPLDTSPPGPLKEEETSP